jgi:NAD(P)-dependent dehydrogenase (short-subunit alcohol dehydrogenase family)
MGVGNGYNRRMTDRVRSALHQATTASRLARMGAAAGSDQSAGLPQPRRCLSGYSAQTNTRISRRPNLPPRALGPSILVCLAGILADEFFIREDGAVGHSSAFLNAVFGKLVEFTMEEWRRVLDTNLTSVFLMCRTFVPHMKGRGYGRGALSRSSSPL